MNTAHAVHGVPSARGTLFANTADRSCTAESAGRAACSQIVKVSASTDVSEAVVRTVVALVFASMEETSTVASNADNE